MSGKKFLVAVYDYARNATTCEVTLDLPGSEARPYFTAFNRTTQYGNAYYNWVGFNQSGGETRLGDMADNNIKAAAFAGGYVFAVDSENRFMVAEDEDMCNFMGHCHPGRTGGAHQGLPGPGLQRTRWQTPTVSTTRRQPAAGSPTCVPSICSPAL